MKEQVIELRGHHSGEPKCVDEDDEDQDKPVNIDVAFGRLRNELASRKTNDQTITGRGGDVRLFMYLLLNQARVHRRSKLDKSEPLHFAINNGRLELVSNYGSRHVTVNKLRDMLEEFVGSDSASEAQFKMEDFADLTTDMVINLDYLSKFKNHSSAMDVFIKNVENCYKLRKLIKEKDPIREKVNAIYDAEQEAIFKDFTSAYGIGYYEGMTQEDKWQIITMLQKHPEYKDRYADIDARYNTIKDALIGYEEKTLLSFLNSTPKYLAILPVRKIIGIKMIILYDLDERL